MGGEIMNVYEKLVEIKKNIKGFNKDTKGFGFEYVSGSQVLRSVRDKMNELGVLLIPSVDYDTMSWEKHEYVTKKGEKKLDFIVTMKMNYTWVNMMLSHSLRLQNLKMRKYSDLKFILKTAKLMRMF